MKKHNVLILCSDEHGARYTGVSGHPQVQTPNFDEMAQGGTRFVNAYTNCPVCVPARACLATGRYVHQTGYWDNAMGYDGRIRGWGHRLQEEGVPVESIGKLHYRKAEDPTGFDIQHNPMHIMDGIGQVWGSVRDPLPNLGRVTPLFAALGAGESKYNRYDRSTADRAVDWLLNRGAENRREPWVLFVGFVAPHFPLVVPEEYLNLYPLDTIPLPKLLPRNGHQRHPWAEAYYRHDPHDDTLGSDERRRLAIASYFGLCTFVDHQVGRVLKALREAGLDGNTLVIYTSDHGEVLGSRGLWGKCNLYREATEIPMILSGPGVREGYLCSTAVTLVDLYPTILEAAGVPLLPEEESLPGASLLRLAAEADDLKRPAFSEYHAVGAMSGAFMLRQGRYKYHYYVGLPPELFDLEEDPEETRNQAEDPACALVLQEFETRLRSLLDPEAVDLQAKSDQRALVERFGGRGKAIITGTPGATPPPEPIIS